MGFTCVQSAGTRRVTALAFGLATVLAFSCGTGEDIDYGLDEDGNSITEAFAPGFSLTVSSTRPAAGSALTVTFVAPSGQAATDIIGLFNASAGNSSWLTSKPTNGAQSGTVTLTVPSAAAGNYEVRYIIKNGFVAPAILQICVGSACVAPPTPPPATGFSLTPATTSPATGSTLSVSFTAPAGQASTDFVGLYNPSSANSSWITSAATNGASSGSVSVRMPATAGSYELRYIIRSGFVSKVLVTLAVGGGGGTGGGSTGGGSIGGGSTGGGTSTTGTNLCAGLVTDKAARPMTSLAKPALYGTVVDREFGTTIRRITAVSPTAGANPALRPMYSTVSAWNSDESLLILYQAGGPHQLYDGKTYQFIRSLSDIHPADLEQVYWSTQDPDILYYVDHSKFVRYHVRDAQAEVMTTFSFCDPSSSSTRASGGTDPFFTSFDSKRIGLGCGRGGTSFIYDISTNTVISRKPAPGENPVQASPSGKLGWFDASGTITDQNLNPLRKLDLKNPAEHSTMGLSPSGVDEWYGVVFDPGPGGNDDLGSLVAFDMTTGKSRVIIGPKTGYPYPPTTHVSAMAYKNPGWAFVSTRGDLTGRGLLDLEIAVANTVDGTVCRVGRHRSWGKANTHLQQSYWAEAHAVPSPSGTRALFASDWGNGTTVDTYVLELPSYQK